MMERDGAGYEAVVFAGGGCRCVWQLGFWDVAAPALALSPRTVGAVSAGAAMACMVFSDTVELGLAYFKRRAAANQRNAYPLNVFRGKPVFPHEEIYRDTILASLDGAAFERLRAGPDIRILLTRPPRWLGPRSSLLLGFVAYELDNLVARSVHAMVGRRIGFEPEVALVRDCRSREDVADLILHSSCTPPFTSALRRGNRPVLDGGLIDAAPVEVVGAPAPRTLVLLTKPCREDEVPRIAGRTYVRPSGPVPVHKWDYTSPAGVQQAFDLGRRDGERFIGHAIAA
jgi:predicted patatin/cPLA2 family phospholipase